MQLTREMTLFLIALVITGLWGFLALSGGPGDILPRTLPVNNSDKYELETWSSVPVGEGLPELSIPPRGRAPFLPKSDVIHPPPIELVKPRLIDLDVTMPPPSPRPGYDQLEGLRRPLVVDAPEVGEPEDDGAAETPIDDTPLEDTPEVGARKEIPEEEWPYVYDSLTFNNGEKRYGEIQDRSNREWGKYGVFGDNETFWWIEKNASSGRVVAAANVNRKNIANITFADTVENFHGIRMPRIPESGESRHLELMRLGEDLENREWRTEDEVQEALGLAAKCYRGALEAKKDDVPALLALTRVYRQSGEWEELLKVLEDAATRVVDPAVHVALGEVYEAFDLPDLALATYEKSLAANATDERLRRRIGDLEFAEGDLDAASEAYGAVVRFGAREEEKLAAQLGLGRIALRHGRVADALAAIDKAEQIGGEPTLEGLALKAAAYYLDGKVEEATEAARAALEMDPADTSAVRTLGLSLALRGQIDEARALFEKARELDPFLYADGCFGLGFVAHVGGNAADAMEWYEHASAAAPRDPYFHYLLGVSYRQDGRLEEAKERFDTALRFAPGFLDVLRQLGLVHQGLGNWSESVKYLKRAVDLAPRDWKLRYVLGCSLLRDETLPGKGRLLAARVQAEKILEIEPDQPLALNLLGYVLYGLAPDQSEEARNKFLRVINLVGEKRDDPDGEYAREREREIREHEMRVIWRDLFDDEEIHNRWVTFPQGIRSRVSGGKLLFSTRNQKGSTEGLFYQWLTQNPFGQLVEVSAEIVMGERADSDVNVGLAITKRRKTSGKQTILVGEIAVGRTFKGKLALRLRSARAKAAKWEPILKDKDDPESTIDWPGAPGEAVRIAIRRTADRRRGHFDIYVNDELVAERVEMNALANRKDKITVGIVGRGQQPGGSWKVALESFEMILERP